MKKSFLCMISVLVLLSSFVAAFSFLDVFSNIVDFFEPMDFGESVTGYDAYIPPVPEPGQSFSVDVIEPGVCSSAGGFCLFKLYSEWNAHFSLSVGEGSYCLCVFGQGYSNVCNVNSDVVMAIGDTSNSHAEACEVPRDGSFMGYTHSAGYDQNICLSNTIREVTCESYEDATLSGQCPEPDQVCVVRLGGDYVNTHGAACDGVPPLQPGLCWDCKFNLSICCSDCIPETEECETDEECCLYGPQQEPTYCSHGLYGTATGPDHGYCCKIGEYYDTGFGVCRETEECGFGGDYPCPYDYTDPSVIYATYVNYWPGCVDPPLGIACCKNTIIYGEPGNYYCEMVVHGPD